MSRQPGAGKAQMDADGPDPLGRLRSIASLAMRNRGGRLKAPAFIRFHLIPARRVGFRRGKEGWQKKHNPTAAGPVRTMSSPYNSISRKILF